MIYIIGDLHLPFGVNKPMDIFGGNWTGYTEKLEKNWKKNITDEDTVILAGDFCWAMTLEEALPDFKFIDKLPGKKIMLKGNHDYWWESITKMNKFFEENNLSNISFLYNNSYNIDGINIYGTKGWDTTCADEYMNIRREAIRLKLSADSIKKLENNLDNKINDESYSNDGNNKIINICVMHYPPFVEEKSKKDLIAKGMTKEEIEEINFIQIMKDIDTKICFYGHLHGEAHKGAIQGNIEGIKFSLISADYLDFNPLCVNKLIKELDIEEIDIENEI